MNKMMEKMEMNVIGWKEKDYSILSLQSFFISQVLPTGKIIKEYYGNFVSSKESAICVYADYTQYTLNHILAKTSSIGYFPVCSELRPMQLSVEELLHDFATGLTGFAKEIEKLLSYKENSELKEYCLCIKEFIKIIPLINFDK